MSETKTVPADLLIDALDQVRIGRGSSGKGGCWCRACDPTSSLKDHTPTCDRVSQIYYEVSGDLPREAYVVPKDAAEHRLGTSEAAVVPLHESLPEIESSTDR